MFIRVTDFHRAFGQLIAASPALPKQSIRELRLNLLIEEVSEFNTAFKENDIVEMADALADICYIIAGTCVSYGIAPTDKFESPYDVFDQVDLFFHTKLNDLITCDFLCYERSELRDDLDGIKDSLMALMRTVFGVALHLGIPLNAVFAEVHRSNMSKLMPDGTVKYREDGKVMKPETWSPPDIRKILGNK